MIYTLTMNTALDLFIELDSFEMDNINRSNYDEITENGKGINVSIVLKHYGIDSKALGFIAGFTGKFIESKLSERKIDNDFIEVSGKTRVNVFTKVNDIDSEFKLINKGPIIDKDSKEQLLSQLSLLTSDDMIIISGSLARGIHEDFIIEVCQLLSNNKVKYVLDSSYKVVMEILKYNPYLLKPNIEELEIFFDKKFRNEKEIIDACLELINQGAQNVLLSLGSSGSIFINSQNIFKVNAPLGKVINTACSGDTLLGTFIAKTETGSTIEESLKYASAAASSTAFSTGITDFKDVNDLIKQIDIQSLNGGS